MEEKDNLKTTYYLFKKERIYNDKTFASVYFKSNKQIVKKSQPIDIDGFRYKMNIETGEVRNYKKSEVKNSLDSSTRRTRILLNMLLEMNTFDWFATLTFDKAKIDRTNDKLVFEAYVKYINNLKHKFPHLGYVTVPERHEDNCIHFHLLLNGIKPKELGLVNSGKVCCSWAWYKDKIASKEYFERTKNEHLNELTDTDGIPVYNVTTFPYGLTTVTRIVSRERCNSYVKKYINKDIGKSTEIFKKRFYYSKNLKVPDIVTRLIGADFDVPEKINNLMSEDSHYKNSNYSKYFEDYNTMQFWEDNDVKEKINRGIVPLSQKEMDELGEIFDL